MVEAEQFSFFPECSGFSAFYLEMGPNKLQDDQMFFICSSDRSPKMPKIGWFSIRLCRKQIQSAIEVVHDELHC